MQSPLLASPLSFTSTAYVMIGVSLATQDFRVSFVAKESSFITSSDHFCASKTPCELFVPLQSLQGFLAFSFQLTFLPLI